MPEFEARSTTMNHEAKRLSLLLDEVSRAMAEWTVLAHEEQGLTSAGAGSGETPRRQLVRSVQDWIQQLSQAVAVRRQEIFTEFMAWEYAGREARGQQGAAVIPMLRVMAEVMKEHLPEAVSDAAVAMVESAAASLDSGVAEPGTELTLDRPRGEQLLRYLEALLEGDSNKAEEIVLNEMRGGATVVEVYEQILQPGQVELGRMWHMNEISVADEHYVTSMTQRLMMRLREHFPRAEHNGRTLVATSIGGDLHDIGVRMVTDYFEMDGWRTYYLGANTPDVDLIQTLRLREADLLAIAVNSTLLLRSLGELIEVIRAAPPLGHLRIIVGGFPFRNVPDLWRELEADGCAATAREAVELGNRLVEAVSA